MPRDVLCYFEPCSICVCILVWVPPFKYIFIYSNEIHVVLLYCVSTPCWHNCIFGAHGILRWKKARNNFTLRTATVQLLCACNAWPCVQPSYLRENKLYKNRNWSCYLKLLDKFGTLYWIVSIIFHYSYLHDFIRWKSLSYLISTLYAQQYKIYFLPFILSLSLSLSLPLMLLMFSY